MKLSLFVRVFTVITAIQTRPRILSINSVSCSVILDSDGTKKGKISIFDPVKYPALDLSNKTVIAA